MHFTEVNLLVFYILQFNARVWKILKKKTVTISFIMSVCLSVWNNSASTGRIFMKNYLSTFRKSVEKICFIKIGQ